MTQKTNAQPEPPQPARPPFSMEQVTDSLQVVLDILNGDRDAAFSKTDQLQLGKLVLRQIVKGQLRLISAEQIAQAQMRSAAPAPTPGAKPPPSRTAGRAAAQSKRKAKRRSTKKG